MRHARLTTGFLGSSASVTRDGGGEPSGHSLAEFELSFSPFAFPFFRYGEKHVKTVARKKTAAQSQGEHAWGVGG
jgi:hypothetical protein